MLNLWRLCTRRPLKTQVGPVSRSLLDQHLECHLPSTIPTLSVVLPSTLTTLSVVLIPVDGPTPISLSIYCLISSSIMDALLATSVYQRSFFLTLLDSISLQVRLEQGHFLVEREECCDISSQYRALITTSSIGAVGVDYGSISGGARSTTISIERLSNSFMKVVTSNIADGLSRTHNLKISRRL